MIEDMDVQAKEVQGTLKISSNSMLRGSLYIEELDNVSNNDITDSKIKTR